jgi:two-component system phosphate regulon sensor histidine kinase PhoR
MELILSNTCPELAEQELQHLFDRFYRVETAHSQQIKGTGLGLSIVRRAVEAHQGTIDVASIPGVETCFTIVLPQLPAPSPSAS